MSTLLLALVWVLVALVGLAGCGRAVADCESSESETEDEPTTTTTATSSSAAACATLITDCPEAQPPAVDLPGRCEMTFPGSVPCLWRPGACAPECGYPPMNAAHLSTLQCAGEPAQFWCCK